MASTSTVISTPNLPAQVTVAALARLVINTSRRFLYPFAPALSRGLGVPLPAITSVIAVNQFTGLLSPLFGPLGDRWGYRAMMLTGLGLLAGGMFAVGFLPLYAALVVGVFLGGLAKCLFDPALQAYMGERVPYSRRGLVVGLIETSWAGSALVGIPLVAVLLERLGWQAPFVALGGLALTAAVALGWIIPAEDRRPAAAGATGPGLMQAWRVLGQSRAVVGVLLFGFFVSLANDTVFSVYGAWLENDFGLGLVAVGSATTVIGVAELLGETLTATLADRLGLRRATLIGVVLSSASYALLPVLGQSLPLALAALFITFVTFEFTIVTTVSLLTEVLPGARATMMSALLATSGLGRVVGALLGSSLWLWGGMLAAGMAAAVFSVVAVVMFLWAMRHSATTR